MVNQIIVDILVNRIMNGGINPKTNQSMVVADIKIEEYRIAVENKILELNQVI